MIGTIRNRHRVTALAGAALLALLPGAAGAAPASPAAPTGAPMYRPVAAAAPTAGGIHALARPSARRRPVTIVRVTVTKRRVITTRVRLRRAGRLELLLTRRRRTVRIGSVVVAQPLTVTMTYRAPRKLRPGRYLLRARLTPPGGKRVEARRRIRVR